MDQQPSNESHKPSKREIFYEFVKYTPAPGFHNAYRSQLCWRSVWIVAILAAWGMTGYQATQQIINYLQFKPNTAITIVV